MAVSSSSPLRRSHTQGRETRRPADRAGHEIRAGGQHEDRESTRTDTAPAVPHARGQGDRMTGRRQLLIVLAGSALAALLSLLAQPPGKARRIGFLWEADTIPPALDAFNAALRELGYVQGGVYQWRRTRLMAMRQTINGVTGRPWFTSKRQSNLTP